MNPGRGGGRGEGGGEGWSRLGSGEKSFYASFNVQLS